MITIKFKYKDKECSIQCNKYDKIIQICQQYSKQNNLDYLSKIFFYDYKKINLKRNNPSLNKLLNLENNNETVFEIIVLEDPDKEIVTRIVNYKGEEYKFKVRKNENIINILATKFKKNKNRFFLLAKGDIITENQNLSQLQENEKILMDEIEERNSVVSVKDTDNGKDNNSPLLPELEPKNNNNNEKIYVPPNDKIYIPPNQTIELEDKNGKEKENQKIVMIDGHKADVDDEQENIIEENHEKHEKENEKKNEAINYDNIHNKECIEKLLKIFLVKAIEYIIIYTLVFFCFSNKINEIFINRFNLALGTFIITTLVGVIIGIPAFNLAQDDNEDFCNYLLGFIYFTLYIFIILFYCFLLSKFTEPKYFMHTISDSLPIYSY